MLLRNHAPRIDSAPVTVTRGYEHVAQGSVAMMQWLSRSGIDYVLVGPVARAIRGDASARGPVTIVPAPYGRNLDRLATALNSVNARERRHGHLIGAVKAAGAQPPKFKAEMLVRPERWLLSCGEHELDVEGRPAGSPSYQELLYESVRISVSREAAVEVASPEDIEHYDHMQRTGEAPEMTVRRLRSAG